MPYIDQARRRFEIDVRGYVNVVFPKSAGELNFTLTALCIDYFRSYGGRYQQINDVLGALRAVQDGSAQSFTVQLSAPEIVLPRPRTKHMLARCLRTMCTYFLLSSGPIVNGCGDTKIDVDGAIEAVKLEFYRRIAAPYEDQAIERNGDVY